MTTIGTNQGIFDLLRTLLPGSPFSRIGSSLNQGAAFPGLPPRGEFFNPEFFADFGGNFEKGFGQVADSAKGDVKDAFADIGDGFENSIGGFGETMQSSIGNVFSGLTGALGGGGGGGGGGSIGDQLLSSVTGLLRRIGESLLQDLFTSIFASLFAEGGHIGAGQLGIVGDRGPELFIPGGGGGGRAAQVINIDARGRDQDQQNQGGNNSGREIGVMVGEAMARDVRGRGPLGRAIEESFVTNRQLATR